MQEDALAHYGAELSKKGEERMAHLRALGRAPTDDEMLRAGLKCYERLISELAESNAAEDSKS
jgi:hypothetical protein